MQGLAGALRRTPKRPKAQRAVFARGHDHILLERSTSPSFAREGRGVRLRRVPGVFRETRETLFPGEGRDGRGVRVVPGAQPPGRRGPDQHAVRPRAAVSEVVRGGQHDQPAARRVRDVSHGGSRTGALRVLVPPERVLAPPGFPAGGALEVPGAAVAVRAARGGLPAPLRVKSHAGHGARVRAPRGAAQRPVARVEHAQATGGVADADQRGARRERRDGGTAFSERIFFRDASHQTVRRHQTQRAVTTTLVVAFRRLIVVSVTVTVTVQASDREPPQRRVASLGGGDESQLAVAENGAPA